MTRLSSGDAAVTTAATKTTATAADVPGPAGGGSAPTPAIDEQALHLRDTGRSYAFIARELGFARSIDARSAFVRAIGRRPVGERADLLRRESARLDVLEKRIRGRDVDEPAALERHLATLARLRQGLE